ncbi:chromosome segregation ATPase [Clostridium punense]|uniref:Chromosome segregation ATPase n=1 Tax=Clostridium punense TaxID=1054297 RepID=A0ABS4K3L6_9CLOT|nr:MULTISPECIES: hypothetical protein [Clostridium]EQB86015.1 hypothetical protein M918_16565 [Clostridium sp. BL8]MBP2022379.1 chromosome segregation ATPase [Clostridium punense]
MENEKMFGLLEKMYIEMQNGFNNLEAEIKETNKRLDNLETKVDNLDTKVNNLETKVDNLETKVDKNTILLEKAITDIETLAEVQQSFSDELNRAKDKDGKTLGERLDVIELAVTSTSKSLNEKFNKLSDKLDDVQIDVNTIASKAAKTDTKVIQFERELKEIIHG